MSVTCAFMSSRPSSNTANSPHGPAPMISTSVLIGSLIAFSRRLACGYVLIWVIGRRIGSGTAASAPAINVVFGFEVPRGAHRTLGLPLGRAHHQAVELGRHLDLARQARVRLHVVAEIEHVLLHRRRFAHRRAPRFVDMHMAGGAGASAAEIGRASCREGV